MQRWSYWFESSQSASRNFSHLRAFFFLKYGICIMHVFSNQKKALRKCKTSNMIKHRTVSGYVPVSQFVSPTTKKVKWVDSKRKKKPYFNLAHSHQHAPSAGPNTILWPSSTSIFSTFCPTSAPRYPPFLPPQHHPQPSSRTSACPSYLSPRAPPSSNPNPAPTSARDRLSQQTP